MTRQYTGNIEHKYVLKETAVRVEQSGKNQKRLNTHFAATRDRGHKKGLEKRGSFFVHIKTRSLNLGKTHSRSVYNGKRSHKHIHRHVPSALFTISLNETKPREWRD